jgi:hypothetical protein
MGRFPFFSEREVGSHERRELSEVRELSKAAIINLSEGDFLDSFWS